MDSLARMNTFTLTDALSREPGVSAMTTGLGISKPVIRGLYGSRVLVLISGLKFDNQQWQDEHGMGMSSFGLDRVEIIKSPLSVLYGSDAIGGMINTIEERKPLLGETRIDYSLKFNTNTLGGLAQYGVYKNNGSNWWRIRVGIENHGDYSDGHGNRVLNSRYDGYYLKATYGFIKGNWTSENHLMSTYNRYGFIFTGVYDFVEEDARWSRALNENPAHYVILNVASSENAIRLKDDSKLHINFGVQSNERMENEGSGAISLNMHLLTTQYLAKWDKDLSSKTHLTLSSLGSFEDNTNYGARKIVPDARLGELNLSAYVSTHIAPKTIWESSVGVGNKWVQTYFTPTVNSPDKEVDPFSKSAPYWSFLSGITSQNEMGWNYKLNVASGIRIPNLAELSADGLHEGIYTFEIGNPLLKNEKSLGVNADVNYSKSNWTFSLTPFLNRFNDYVYLAPTNEDWFGFPVYRYKQQNATQFGSEASVSYRTRKLTAKLTYEGLISRTDDGNYTPFIPPQQIKPSVAYGVDIRGLPVQWIIDAQICMTQTQVAANETTTPAYTLLNAGASTHWASNGRKYEMGLYASNIFNTYYFNHLSRLKNYGVYDMGFNLAVYFKAQLNR